MTTTLLGITFDQNQPKPDQTQRKPDQSQPTPPAAIQPVDFGKYLRPTEVPRYPGFSFCVAATGVDQSLEAVAKARLETALLEVMQHPYWTLLRPGSPPPLVDIGCPSEPLIARPGVDWDGPNFYARGNIHQYNVAEPSFYWTFIFVMPGEQISQLLGDAYVPHAPQEYRGEGSVERIETTAIFLSPQQLEDPSFLVRQLLIAVGLESAFPESQFPDRGHR